MATQAQRIRDIVKALPRLNCGLCGYGNCGGYARAVAEGKAPPNLCCGGPLVWQKVARGAKMPAAMTTAAAARTDELMSLRQRQRELARQLGILRRRVRAAARRG